jgi:CheY-like chemotaxis protein
VPSVIHVLVVDDDAIARNSMKALLEAAGYAVSCAADGREALDHLRRVKPPAAILLDLAMPVMTGWQFRCEQQSDPALAFIPVVVLSAEYGLKEIAATLRVAGWFVKPVDVERLLVVLRAVTECTDPAPAAA